MKKLKFKNMEEKKEDQKKKEYGRTRTVLYFFPAYSTSWVVP